MLRPFEKAFTHENIKLHGWFMERVQEKCRKLIIYFGGNAEEVSYSFTEYQKHTSCSLLFVNYRSYGKSEGKPSQDALFLDGLYLFDEILRQTNRSPKDVILVGRSLGSGVASYVASKRKIGGVILITPYDSLKNVASKRYFMFPLSILLKHPFNSVSYAEKITAPLLAIIAAGDTVIPPPHSKSLYNAWKGSKKSFMIEGANHQNVSNFDAYWDEINAFISKL